MILCCKYSAWNQYGISHGHSEDDVKPSQLVRFRLFAEAWPLSRSKSGAAQASARSGVKISVCVTGAVKSEFTRATLLGSVYVGTG